MARLIVLGVLAGVALLAAGCSPQATVGEVVGEPQARAGAMAPSFSFVDRDGKKHDFAVFRGDATLVVFVEQPCAKAKSDIVTKSVNLPPAVNVAEITNPPGGCKAHKECCLMRGDEGRRLVSLCDGTGKLHELFGVPSDGGAVVLDFFGNVAARGTLADLDKLGQKAETLAAEIAEERSDYYAY